MTATPIEAGGSSFGMGPSSGHEPGSWLLSFQFQRLIAEHPAEFRLGYAQGDGALGLPIEGGLEDERIQAYELGRALRRGVWS